MRVNSSDPSSFHTSKDKFPDGSLGKAGQRIYGQDAGRVEPVSVRQALRQVRDDRFVHLHSEARPFGHGRTAFDDLNALPGHILLVLEAVPKLRVRFFVRRKSVGSRASLPMKNAQCEGT